jgi:beta-phosphoglucomutase
VKIKAVLFDMDGVLIDAKEWHYQALNLALGLFGYEINHHDHLTCFDGLPTRIKLTKLTLEKGLPEGLHSFINEMKQQYTISLIRNLCRPRFNHEYALSRLKDEGYKTAICSNSVKLTIELMMEQAKLTNFFDLILSNEDVSKPKPDPEMYLKAFDRFGLSGDECLIVEDNENGVKAAKASGAHVMVVSTVEEVTYEAIRNRVRLVEGEGL